MSKTKSIFVCKDCGYESTKWLGQCPSCESWNSFIEDVVMPSKSSYTKSTNRTIAPVELSKISVSKTKRISSNISEFDRVLGGGFVPGQVILLSGDPGIGKSTLLTEIAKNLKKIRVLYICGEESTSQIKLRTTRMGYSGENLLVLSETDVFPIIESISSSSDVGLVIIDSIQTLRDDDFSGIAGSISQIKGCSQLLTNTAKRTGIPLILVGHVTKEGVTAGPKLLEHIVDTVLYLEGDSQHMFRLLRTNKNRFGPVSEVGVFEMLEEGMKEIKNPSDLFLGEAKDNISGSCITVVMEGFRPLLFEIQALTVPTSFGYPRRTTSGFNNNRLQVLIAILEKRLNLSLSNFDVYLSVAGGFKVNEYSCDLAVCLAIVSSLKNIPIKANTAVFGECGLGGEIRKVSHTQKRINEAKKLGYTNVISPESVKTLQKAVNLAFK